MKNGAALLPIALSGLFFFSCVSQGAQTADHKELLKGKWLLNQAEMNGEDRSDRMRGTFFHFLDNQTVASNFNPQGESAEYTYNWEASGEIMMSGGFSPVFKHNFIGTDSLVLETFLQQNRIRFFLLRSDHPNGQGQSQGTD